MRDGLYAVVSLMQLRSRSDIIHPKLRVALALRSGDTLDSLPLVDWDWHQFASRSNNKDRNRLEMILNSVAAEHLVASGCRFARIGLARPWNGRCWLMLDSLFPLPKTEWLAAFR